MSTQRFRSPAHEILAPSGPFVSDRQRELLDVGRRVRGKTTTPARLLPSVNRRDPAAPRPQLTARDADAGVLDLLSRGLLPPTADLTPALAGTGGSSSGVLRNTRTKLHQRGESPARALPFSSRSGFNAATLRLDLTPQPTQALQPPKTETQTPAKSLEPPAQAEEERRSAAARVVVAFQGESSLESRRTKTSRRPVSPPPHATNQEEDASMRPDDPIDADDGEAGAMEELGANVAKIRGYTAQLAASGAHQFLVVRGRAARESPEFAAFARAAADAWGAVDGVVRALEALAAHFFVPLAHVDGARVLALAATGAPRFERHELLRCLANEAQVAALLARPGQRFRGKDRRRRAALALQAAWRMRAARNAFLAVRRRTAAACAIQQRWRVFAAREALHHKLEALRRERQADFDASNARLRSQWPCIARGRRVAVHVPSLSGLDAATRLRARDLGVRENLQLAARLAALALDPQLELVYVSPFELPAEALGYALKLLQLGHGPGHGPDPSARLTVVVPEQSARLPRHLPLATLLLLSPRALARVRRRVQGREAYVVAGRPGLEDARLAMALRLPVLGFAPPAAALSSRSSARRVFARADVNARVGAADLFSEREAELALARLAVQHLELEARWTLRLDVDPFGDGAAVVDTQQLESLRELRRERRPADFWRQPGARDAAVRRVAAELERRSLAALASPERRDVFPTWRAFADAMARGGATLEAEPRAALGRVLAHVFVEPGGSEANGGRVHVVATHDVLPGGAGVAFPQCAAPREAVEGAARAVAAAAARDHALWGHATIELELFQDALDARPRLAATALHPFLTDAAASVAVFRLLTRRLEPPSPAPVATATATDLVLLEAKAGAVASSAAAVPRCYVLSDYVRHAGVAARPAGAFFQSCRLHGVCLDVAAARGSVFLLPDSLAAGAIGVLALAESPAGAVAFLRAALEVLAREAGTGGVCGGEGDGTEGDNFGQILAAVRTLEGGGGRTDKRPRRR